MPDLDGSVSGGDEPIVLGAESQCVDGATSIERVEMLTIIDIPEHATAPAGRIVCLSFLELASPSVAHNFGLIDRHWINLG